MAPVVCSITDAAASDATFAGGLVSEFFLGSGFFASSALKPGGGNPDPPVPVVEVSVA